MARCIQSLYGEFFRILNGPIGEKCLNHYSEQPVDLPTLAAQLVPTTMQLLFSACPTVPSLNKWTKLGLALDWVMNASLHSIVQDSLDDAFSSPTVQLEKKSVADTGLCAGEASLLPSQLG